MHTSTPHPLPILIVTAMVTLQQAWEKQASTQKMLHAGVFVGQTEAGFTMCSKKFVWGGLPPRGSLGHELISCSCALLPGHCASQRMYLQCDGVTVHCDGATRSIARLSVIATRQR